MTVVHELSYVSLVVVELEKDCRDFRGEDNHQQDDRKDAAAAPKEGLMSTTTI